MWGNGRCDAVCDRAECGWDFGDCRECSLDCKERQINDGTCDLACLNPECAYDGKDCANFEPAMSLRGARDIQVYSNSTTSETQADCEESLCSLTDAINFVTSEGNETENYSIYLHAGTHKLEVLNKRESCGNGTMLITTFQCGNYSGKECTAARAIIQIENFTVTFSICRAIFHAVIITGLQPLSSNCPACAYCPDPTLSGSTSPDMNNKNPDESLCQQYSDISLFNVTERLELKFVDIMNIKYEPLAVFSLSETAKLVMEDVRLLNIITKREEGAVIFSQSHVDADPPPIDYPSVYFRGGSVAYINNGFEYKDEFTAGAFISTGGFEEIVIERVEFVKNIGNSDNEKALFWVKRAMILRVTECTFRYNVAGNLFKIDNNNLCFDLKNTNSDGHVIDSEVTHISFLNCTFDRNYVNYGLLSFEFLDQLQNLYFHNVAITNNYCTGSQLITLKYIPDMTDDVSKGEWKQIDMDTSIYIAPRYVSISHCEFYANFANTVLWIENLANINISNTVFANNNFGDFNQTLTIFSAFQADKLAYMKSIPAGSVEDCEHLVLMKKVFGLGLYSINVWRNYCANGPAGFAMDYVVLYLTVADSNFTRNESRDTLGSVFFFTAIRPLCNFTNCSFTYNQNSAQSSKGLLHFDTAASISITSCLFLSNSVGAFTCVSANDPCSFSVNYTEFESNTASMGVGAAVAVSLSSGDDTSALAIVNSRFLRNRCDKGSGAAVIILSPSRSRPFKLLLSSLAMEQNYAKLQASAVSIDSQVQLMAGSRIENCSFVGHSGVKGTLWIAMNTGELIVSHCLFHANHLEDTSAIYFVVGSLTVKDSIFNSSTSQYVVMLADTNTVKYLNTINCTFIDNTAKAVYTQHAVWVDSNSRFLRNLISAAKLTEYSRGELCGTVFIGNQGDTAGGGLALSINSNASCTNCEFRGNRGPDYGGAVFTQILSKVDIVNSTFVGNTAKENGSAIFQIACFDPVSTITNSTFLFNSAGSSATIYLQTSNLNMTAVTLANNTANSITSGILLNLSELYVNFSTFSNQSAVRGAFLSAVAESSAWFYKSSFSNGEATSGGAFNLLSSKLTVTDCVLKKLKAVSGGAFYASSSSSVVIQSASVQDLEAVEGGIGIISESNLTVSNLKFRHFATGGIQGDKMTVVRISDSVFEDGVGELGGGFQCTRCGVVLLERDTFTNITAERGGGVYIATLTKTSQSSRYELRDCVFRNTSALRGGGALTDDMTVSYSNCSFIGNSAKNKSEDSSDWGRGGALACDCSTASSCHFNITNCHFENNTADTSGGAITWRDAKPLLQNCTFSGNSAPYGGNISSYPVAIKVVSSGRRLDTTSLSNIASGQEANQSIVVALVDHYGQIITIDNESTAELLAGNETQISGNTKATAINGEFSFQRFTITATPNTTTQVRVFTSAIDTNKKKKANDETVYEPNITISVEMRKCITGENRVGNICFVCGLGTYSLDPEEICATCPKEATCLGNFTMVPRSGYWRARPDTAVFYECLFKPACIESSKDEQNISLTGCCAEGYTGNLCQVCKPGYSRSGKNECSHCPSESTNVVRLIFVSLSVVVIAGVMVFTTLKSAHREKSLASIYIKILLNYLQIVVLTASFNLDWPQLVKDLFSVQESTGALTDQAFSFDCLLQSNNKRSDSVIYNKMLILAVLPILVLFSSLVVWTFIQVYKRTATFPKDETIATIVILLFLAHPTLTKQFFNIFTCKDIDGTQYLLQQLDVKCWTKSHSLYSTACALPAIIVWVLGVPAWCLLYLVINRRKLSEIAIKVRLGFLFNGYRKRAYFWEFVILYRKISIICCSVFLANVSIPVQALVVLLVLSTSMYMQDLVQPYMTPELNRMELKSLICATVTIYCGLYFLTGDLGDSARMVLFLGILLSNLLFIWSWAGRMFGYYITLLISKIPLMQRKLGNIRKVKDGLEDDLFVDPVSHSAFQMHPAHKKLPVTADEAQHLQSMHDLYVMKLDAVISGKYSEKCEGPPGTPEEFSHESEETMNMEDDRENGRRKVEKWAQEIRNEPRFI